MAVKVNNVYIRENASLAYERVNTVYANGVQVFGMHSDLLVNGIYIKFNGYNGREYLYTITLTNGVLKEGQTMIFVGYLVKTNASSPYEPTGSQFTRGQVTMTSNTGILGIPNPSFVFNALYIGVVIFPRGAGIYGDLVNEYQYSTYPNDTLICANTQTGHRYMQASDGTKAYLTNIPYGAGIIHGSSDDIWLLYRGQHTWEGNQLVYGNSTWRILTSHIYRT